MAERTETERILERLVAFDTTSRNSNRELVDEVCNRLDHPENRIERFERDGKINLVVRRGPQRDDGEGLVLCGHTDTVPADEPEWTHDPHRLFATDERLYARGACDMKGFLALAVDRMERAGSLEAPLALLFTCDEEVGSLGAQWFVTDASEIEPLPRRTLIGEPTRMEAVRLHKGHLRGSLSFHGTPAHSGLPHRGVNAIHAAGRALVALADLQEELRREPPASAEHFPAVPFEVINPALIEGGSAVNVIPESCRIDFGIRLLPGSDADGLLARIDSALAALDLEAGWEIGVGNLSPALETPADEPLFRELCDLLGQDGSPAASFSSDAGVLSQAGFDCVLFGPGSIDVAHKPDEFIPREELEAAGGIVDQLIGRFCQSPA